MVGTIYLDRCKSLPDALAPYLNKLIKFVPDPKGPNCKTELSAQTIETIQLHGQKESEVPPGDTERISYASVPGDTSGAEGGVAVH